MKKFEFINPPPKESPRLLADISNKKILMGFWHNWPAGSHDGYQQGSSSWLNLTDVPIDYNVVGVAFMKGVGIPTFQPYNLSDEEFKRQVDVLNNQDRAVLISLGGADAHIELIGAAANQHVIPTALKIVKDYFAGKAKHFIISMAPEFPYLTQVGLYIPYLTALEGYYDFIAPQFYNQGGDGVWVQEVNNGQGAWIAQNNDAMKEDFLYYLTESLVTGTRGFTAIPANKFVIGLPTNIDAAATGYVINPQDLDRAFSRLNRAGFPIKGLMTWSINWDNGKNKDGVSYHWEFIKRYAHLIDGNQSGGNEKPNPPQNLAALEEKEININLRWNYTNTVKYFSIYRDGSEVGQALDFQFKDSGLNPNTSYSYFVTATNTDGVVSLPSNSITIKTLRENSSSSGFPEWKLNYLYTKDDRASYLGKHYICINTHTSNAAWTPDVALTLWSLE